MKSLKQRNQYRKMTDEQLDAVLVTLESNFASIGYSDPLSQAWCDNAAEVGFINELRYERKYA